MKDFISVALETKELSAKARKEALKECADRTGIARAFRHVLSGGKDARTLLRALCDLSGERVFAEIILHYAGIHEEEFLSVLSADDPKLRKTCAQLMGRLDADRFAQPLMDAFQRETIEFVKPSIILALGNAAHSDGTLSFLQKISVPEGGDKNLEEQRIALGKALSSLIPLQIVRPILPLGRKLDLIASCPNVKVAVDEFTRLGYRAEPSNTLYGYINLRGVSKFESIYAARSFYAAGAYFSEFSTLSAALKGITSKSFIGLVHAVYGTDKLAYRVELKSRAKTISSDMRRQAARTLSSALSTISGLQNSPSSYAFEIRILEEKGRFHVALFPSTKIDGRFAYRASAISASMHPAVAASCLCFIREFIRSDAHVLDCFCGSGTPLFERAKYPYASLTGTDISTVALKAARTNERLAKTGAHFLIKNATTPFEQKYDEVICNLPFGLRVSNHRENRNLYQKFLQNLPSILVPNGLAFLFTNDKKLLSELLENSFELVKRANFEAGGLYPALYVLHPKKG